MKSLEEIVNIEDFEKEIEESYLEGWNNTIITSDWELTYDCGQLIQLQDSSYAGTVSYIEVEIKNTFDSMNLVWSILIVINNYPSSMGPSLIQGYVEDRDEVKRIMEEFVTRCEEEE